MADEADSGKVAVVIGDDYYTGAEWRLASPLEISGRYAGDADYGVYLISRDTLTRWDAAEAAFREAQEEAHALTQARRQAAAQRRHDIQ